MTYFLTIIITTTGAILSFVTGMVYLEHVASWSDTSRADILVVFLSGFFSALCFGALYTIYEVKTKYSVRRTRLRRR
tara:strand:- start:211 stop:441 length:231 start_codon:yes stop_codon:yes gene_type:complete